MWERLGCLEVPEFHFVCMLSGLFFSFSLLWKSSPFLILHEIPSNLILFLPVLEHVLDGRAFCLSSEKLV